MSDFALRYPEARVFPDRPCEVCGQPTNTPPECRGCAIDEDARAVRREDGAGR